MLRKKRETLLKIGVGALVGLWLLDVIILEPVISHWKDQSERIAKLDQDVQRGRQLKERGNSLRARWNEMQRTDLPDNDSLAENDVFKAVGKWGRDSRISFTNLQPQWRKHDEGYDTLECRAQASGDQASIGRLVYELETDPLPARVNELELSAKDNAGKLLNLSIRFTFVRLTEVRKGATHR